MIWIGGQGHSGEQGGGQGGRHQTSWVALLVAEGHEDVLICLIAALSLQLGMTTSRWGGAERSAEAEKPPESLLHSLIERSQRALILSQGFLSLQVRMTMSRWRRAG